MVCVSCCSFVVLCVDLTQLAVTLHEGSTLLVALNSLQLLLKAHSCGSCC